MSNLYGELWAIRLDTVTQVKAVKRLPVWLLVAGVDSDGVGIHWHGVVRLADVPNLPTSTPYAAKIRTYRGYAQYLAKNAQNALERHNMRIAAQPPLPDTKAPRIAVHEPELHATDGVAGWERVYVGAWAWAQRHSVKILLAWRVAGAGGMWQPELLPIAATSSGVRYCKKCKVAYPITSEFWDKRGRCKQCQRRYESTRASGGKRATKRRRQRAHDGLKPMWE